MTSLADVVPVSDPQAFAAPPLGSLAPIESTVPPDLHQEINARRARVENTELLQHLRGL